MVHQLLLLFLSLINSCCCCYRSSIAQQLLLLISLINRCCWCYRSSTAVVVAIAHQQLLLSHINSCCNVLRKCPYWSAYTSVTEYLIIQHLFPSLIINTQFFFFLIRTIDMYIFIYAVRNTTEFVYKLQRYVEVWTFEVKNVYQKTL